MVDGVALQAAIGRVAGKTCRLPSGWSVFPERIFIKRVLHSSGSLKKSPLGPDDFDLWSTASCSKPQSVAWLGRHAGFLAGGRFSQRGFFIERDLHSSGSQFCPTGWSVLESALLLLLLSSRSGTPKYCLSPPLSLRWK